MFVTAIAPDTTRHTVNTGRGAYKWQPNQGYARDVVGVSSIDRYERISWRDIETSQGVYAWTVIDEAAAAAAAAGGRLLIRFYAASMYKSWQSNEPAGPLTTNLPPEVDPALVPTALALPNYVRAQCNPWITPYIPASGEQLVIPDWNNEFFLTRFLALIAAVGARYGNDPRVLGAEVGGYGNFGEQHNIFYDSFYANNGASIGGRAEITVANMLRLFTAWNNAFPTKWILSVPMSAMLIPGTNTRSFTPGAQILDAAMAANPKLGFRCDSLGQTSVHDGIEQVFDSVQAMNVANGRTGNDQLRNRLRRVFNTGEGNGDLSPGDASNNFLNGMLDLTTWNIATVPNAGWRGGYDPTANDGAGDFRPSYGLELFNEAERAAYLEMCRKAGFVLRTSQIEAPKWVNPGSAMPINVTWKNDGAGWMVEPWTVTYRLHSSTGAMLRSVTSTVDLRTLAPGATLVDAASFDTTGLALDENCTISVRAVHADVPYAQPLQLINTGVRMTDGGYAMCPIALATAEPVQKQSRYIAMGSAPSVNYAVPNTMRIKTSVGTATNHPLLFTRMFRDGEIPSFPQVLIDGTPRFTQVDNVDRYPSGCVKRADCSLIVPSVGTSWKTLSFRNQITSNNGSPITVAQMLGGTYDFDAVIDIKSGGASVAGAPISARAALGTLTDAQLAGQARREGFHVASGYHHKGSVCTTVILCDHTGKAFDVGTNATKALRPSVHATFWSTGHCYVRPLVENSDTMKLKNEIVDVSFSTGNASPVVRDSKAGYEFVIGGFLTRAYWIGTPPAEVVIDHNTRYLASTLAIPNFDTSIAINAASIDSYAAQFASMPQGFGDNGFWQKVMAGPGGRPDLSLFPKWEAVWLLSYDPRMLNIVKKQTEFGGSWGYYFREGDVARNFAPGVSNLGITISKSSRPGQFFGDNANSMMNSGNVLVAADKFVIDGTNTNTSGWTWDSAHSPGVFYALAITQGEYFHWEKLQQKAYWTHYLTNPSPSYNTGIGSGHSNQNLIMNGVQQRMQGWAMRDRARSWYLAYEGSALKTQSAKAIRDHLKHRAGLFDLPYYQGDTIREGWVTNRAAWFDPAQVAPTVNALGFPWKIVSTEYKLNVDMGPTPANALNQGTSVWQPNYSVLAYAHLVELGFTEALPFRNHFAALSMGIVAHPTLYWRFGDYQIPAMKLDATLFQTFDDMFSAVTWPPTREGITAYPSNGQAVGTYGLTIESYSNYNSATAAMCSDIDGKANWNKLKPIYDGTASGWSHDPRWAIVPRN